MRPPVRTCALIAAAVAGCMPARFQVARPADRGSPDVATLVAGVRVVDGRGDAATGPVDVLVAGGKVLAVGAPGQVPAPADAVRVPGEGRTLMPGLVDMHVHLGGSDGSPPWAVGLPDTRAQLARFPYAGVTTVLDALGQADLAGLRQEIRDGRLAGPLVYRASRGFTAPGGHPAPMFRAVAGSLAGAVMVASALWQVDTPEEARIAVRREVAEHRPTVIKVLFDDIPPGTAHLARTVLDAIVAEARAHATRVVVHVGSVDEALAAVDAGASMLMHTPWEDVLSDEQARRIAASGVPLVTTARVMAAVGEVWRVEPRFDPLDREVAGAALLATFQARPAGWVLPEFPPAYFDTMPTLAKNTGENVKRLKAAGARLFAGTDCGVPSVFQGSALHQELAALVALGFTPAEALRAATSAPADWLEPGGGMGVIAPGSRADLVLVEGDPTQDIAAASRIAAVWLKGRRVERRPAP